VKGTLVHTADRRRVALISAHRGRLRAMSEGDAAVLDELLDDAHAWGVPPVPGTSGTACRA